MKNTKRGLTKKEERLGWITRGHELQATGNKPQATSYKQQAQATGNRRKKIKIKGTSNKQQVKKNRVGPAHTHTPGCDNLSQDNLSY